MLATLLPALKDLGLPLKLQLWDGKEMDIGPAPSVTLVIKDPNLVTQLARPSLDVLGAAYVEGHIDLLGPVEEVIGPHVVSGGWWIREISRDYYYVRTRSGRWLWIYNDRRRRRWFLQGEVE